MVTPVNVKKLDDSAVLPTFGHSGDAGADIRSIEEVYVPAGGRRLVRTGIALELPPNTEAQVRPRSGLAAKNGITVLNTPGTIDSNYRGEVKVILYNTTRERFKVTVGMRIAQLVIKPVTPVLYLEVVELTDTTRGEDGFGSTGVA